MNLLNTLLQKIKNRNYTIGIVGLGYDGLPLMWTFHKNNMPVLGFDIASKKVENLKKGIPYINHLGTEMMETLAKSNIADSKPFGFMKFTPGPGMGGHCIPIDPFYLTWKALEFEKHTRFIELAREVNTHMPTYMVDRTMHALNAHKKAMNGSKVLVIGLAYKPDVDDMRESPTFKIFFLLKKNGAEVSYYDPYLPVIPKNRDNLGWIGARSIEWNKEIISGFDAVIISTDHSSINYSELAEWSACVVDTRNKMSGIETKNENHIFKA